MDAYEICKGCSCFIKRAEARCPFCGVEHVAARGAPRRIPRVSRAQWLAVASALTVTGCSGAVASPSGSSSSGEQGEDHDAATDAAVSRDGGAAADAHAALPDAHAEATTEAGVQPEASTACSAALQPFECGTTLCNPATDYCNRVTYGGGYFSCEANDAGYPFPEQCTACPTCECISSYITGACHCIELDAGGIGIQCAACYGAPPARLERLSGRRSRRAPRMSPPFLLPVR